MSKLPANSRNLESWQEIVQRHVGSLQFGLVQIVVHDSQVTQIEKTERLRLEKPRAQNLWVNRATGA